MKRENKHLSPVDIAALKQTIVEKNGVIEDLRNEVRSLTVELEQSTKEIALIRTFYKQLFNQLTYFLHYETETR